MREGGGEVGNYSHNAGNGDQLGVLTPWQRRFRGVLLLLELLGGLVDDGGRVVHSKEKWEVYFESKVES